MPEIKFSPIRIKIPTISLKWIITVIFVVLACLFLFIIIPSARSAKKATDQFGIASGTAAGTAGGAAQILLDWDEIRNEAVEDATKVEDTKTDFITQIQKGGKLEVLSAKVTTYNIEVDGKSYASLSVNPGMVYFTVDLSSLSDNNVQVSNKKIMITLPEPEVELNFDYAKVNKVAEYKNKDIFDNLPVDNDLAVYAHQASVVKTKKDAEKEIKNFNALMTSAKQAAETQIEQLCQIFKDDSYSIQIRWKEAN